MYADEFNRMGSSAISAMRRKLASGGWVDRVKKTHGNIPDTYVKGTRLKRNTSLDRQWSILATSLYGKDGLFTKFTSSPGWGHQCLNAGGMAVLAALSKASQTVTTKDLVNYFSPICSETTIKNGVKKLQAAGIVRDSSGVLFLVSDWESRLRVFFLENECCLDRSIRGSQKRSFEQEQVRRRVAEGELTPIEKQKLRRLPCVRCGGRATEQEHFPPKRFLKGVKHEDGRSIVWAICRQHNNESSQFIKSLRQISPRKGFIVTSPGVDPKRLYHAEANRLLPQWYEAVDNNDVAAGEALVQRILDLYVDCLRFERQSESSRPLSARKKTPRTQIGKRASGRRSVTKSQLPLT